MLHPGRIGPPDEVGRVRFSTPGHRRCRSVFAVLLTMMAAEATTENPLRAMFGAHVQMAFAAVVAMTASLYYSEVVGSSHVSTAGISGSRCNLLRSCSLSVW